MVRKNGCLQFGLITKNSEQSDDDEVCEDDDDEYEEPEKISPGFVRVAWHPEGKEKIIREKKVKSSIMFHYLYNGLTFPTFLNYIFFLVNARFLCNRVIIGFSRSESSYNNAQHITKYIFHFFQLFLVDRSLLHGDVVRRRLVSPGQTPQLGLCRQTHVSATVQIIGSNQVVYGVNGKDLQMLEVNVQVSNLLINS
jgi:hypothetical protein